MKHISQIHMVNSLPVLNFPKNKLKLKKRIHLQNFCDFGRELSLLISTGISMTKALDMIAHSHERTEMKALILEIKAQIELGKSLASALQKYPSFFSPLFIQLTLIGEQTGTLAAQLNQAAAYLEKFLDFKNKLVKALSYPVCVIIFTCFIMIGVLTFIIPQFQSLFQSLGGELPTLTRFMIKAFMSLKYSFALFLVFLIISLPTFYKLQKQSPRVALRLDQFLLRTPKLGQLITYHLIARVFHLLAVTHESDIPFPTALSLLSQSIKNRVYSQASLSMQTQIKNGTLLHAAFANTGLFPNRAVQMIYMGEQSGSLSKILKKLGDYYEKRLDQQVEQVNKFLEPVMIGILGIGMGSLIIAMYLPIFRLGSLF